MIDCYGVTHATLYCIRRLGTHHISQSDFFSHNGFVPVLTPGFPPAKLCLSVPKPDCILLGIYRHLLRKSGGGLRLIAKCDDRSFEVANVFAGNQDVRCSLTR